MNDAMNAPAVQNMSDEDAQITIAVIGKIKNQTGNVSEKVLSLLDNPATSKDQVLKKINSIYPQVVKDGVVATERGAKLHYQLTHDQGGMGKLFRAQIELDPSLVKSGFQTHAEPQVLDAMFRNPAKAQKLIDAVNNGESYQIDNHANRIKDEAYTVGVTKDGTL